MSRLIIDLREHQIADLPEIEFDLGDAYKAVAKIAKTCIDAHVADLNERDKKEQG